MKGKKSIISVAVLFFLLILTVSLVLAQGAGTEPDADAEPPPQPEVQAALSTVPRVIPIQGRLTDDAGTPITGTRNITLTLYTAGGAVMCQSMQSVSANNGLFNTEINTCTNHDIDGKELYLGIQVESDPEMTPRQQLYPVPYAYSLVPGAIISDTIFSPILSVRNNSGDGIRIDADDYGIYIGRVGRDGVWVDQAVDDGFYVSNAGGDGVYIGNAGSHGVYVGSAGVHGVYARSDSTTGRGVSGWANTESGENYGVYGRSDSPDGYGMYGVNYDTGGVAIMAAGTGIIKSVADTDIAVSALNMVLDYDNSGNPSIRPESNGFVTLRPNGTGAKFVYLPVDLPSQLFGVDQKLKSIRVCCDMDTASSYLTGIYVFYANDSGGRTTLFSDASNRTNTSWSCYTSTDSTPVTINGPVFIRFDLYYTGTGSTHDIKIGKVTLTLTEK
jgi:hypothetical protein